MELAPFAFPGCGLSTGQPGLRGSEIEQMCFCPTWSRLRPALTRANAGKAGPGNLPLEYSILSPFPGKWRSHLHKLESDFDPLLWVLVVSFYSAVRQLQ